MKKSMIRKVCLGVSCLLLSGMLLTGCSEKEDSSKDVVPYLEQLTYSNLSDEESQNEVRKAFERAGIEEEDIQTFFENVNEYNQTIEKTGLTVNGFEESKEIQPSYDIVRLQELWEAKHPDYLGHNCRLTSLGLMKNFVEINNPLQIEDSELVFDTYAMESLPKQNITPQQKSLFRNIFASIETLVTKDIQVHLQNVKKDWETKQIRFRNQERASLIFVFFNFVESEEKSTVYVGHVGLLFPTEDGKFLFVEKVSFQEPYQAIKFDNKVQLNDYLMNKYDTEWGQPSSRPFIMENDDLLEGYRPNPNNGEEK